MKVVIDTNVLISALINPDGVPSRLLDDLEPIGLLSSEMLLSEFERVLRYPRIQRKYSLTDDKIEAFVERVRQASKIIEINESEISITRDPDDDRFLVCAFVGGADYVVSGDKHLLEIAEYHGIRIITPSRLLAILEEKDDLDIS